MWWMVDEDGDDVCPGCDQVRGAAGVDVCIGTLVARLRLNLYGGGDKWKRVSRHVGAGWEEVGYIGRWRGGVSL